MLTQVELEQAHCWFPSVDMVPGQPRVTEFKQAARLHQARWRGPATTTKAPSRTSRSRAWCPAWSGQPAAVRVRQRDT